jgi:Zn finger protein HypA/HybF involved in hydrogenase expression
MYYSTPSVNVGCCTAHITRNRNRSKIYGDSIYLKDGENFEIELFNPTTARVLAKINLNGKSISESGIILRPGERVYLERFIDTNNKFLFETYEVDKSNEALNAIIDNGMLEVSFYKESNYINPRVNYGDYFKGVPPYNPSITIGTNIGGSTGIYYSSDVFGSYCSDSNFSLGGSTINNLFTTTSMTNDSVKGCNASNSLETGRVEMGEFSNQEFRSVSANFMDIAETTIKYRILPESQKPLESSSIRNYCTDCGTRMKKQTWKFCPNCGSKI